MPMLRYNPLPPFFLLLLFVFTSPFHGARTLQQSGYVPNWLNEGSSVAYEFGLGNYKGVYTIFFNDSRAFGSQIAGNYSWKVIAIEDGKARIEVVFNLIIPGSQTYEEYLSKLRAHEGPSVVQYTGKRFVELAEKGNFSLFKTVPQDQIDKKKVSIVNNPDQGVYAVQFWGRFHINEVFYITLDLYNLTMINEPGEDWGKWLLWCNPVFYPVDREVKEVALYKWMNETNIERTISYRTQEKLGWPDIIETPVGNFDEYYLGSISPRSIEDPNLVPEGEKIYLLQGLTYETRIGLLLTAGSGIYVDDILAQKLGIVKIGSVGYFWLAKLEGIEIVPKSSNGIDLTSYTLHLVVAIVVTSAIAVYWGSRRRHRH